MDLKAYHMEEHQRRMAGFLLVAMAIHASVFICLQLNGVGVRPELPDWLNIKLVAGTKD